MFSRLMDNEMKCSILNSGNSLILCIAISKPSKVCTYLFLSKKITKYHVEYGIKVLHRRNTVMQQEFSKVSCFCLYSSVLSAVHIFVCISASVSQGTRT